MKQAIKSVFAFFELTTLLPCFPSHYIAIMWFVPYEKSSLTTALPSQHNTSEWGIYSLLKTNGYNHYDFTGGKRCIIITPIKGGSFRFTEPAGTWSTMVNKPSSVKKCTRKALVTFWERDIHLNTAVLAILNQEYWCESVEITPTKHGLQLGLGSIQKIYVFIPASAVSSFQVTEALRNLENRLFTKMGVSPPMGIQQTPACQTQLHCHELPTTHLYRPTHPPLWCLRNYFQISPPPPPIFTSFPSPPLSPPSPFPPSPPPPLQQPSSNEWVMWSFLPFLISHPHPEGFGPSNIAGSDTDDSELPFLSHLIHPISNAGVSSDLSSSGDEIEVGGLSWSAVSTLLTEGEAEQWMEGKSMTLKQDHRYGCPAPAVAWK